MEDLGYSDRAYLHAFMKTAQYLASLTTHEDVWRHIAQVMVSFYGAESAGFAGPGVDGEIEFHHLLAPDDQSRALLSSKDVQDNVREVLENGFLALCSLSVNEEPHTFVLLPISLDNRTAGVMLVGHATAGTISSEVLNVYLADLRISRDYNQQAHLRNRTQRAPLPSSEACLRAYRRTHPDPRQPETGNSRAYGRPRKS